MLARRFALPPVNEALYEPRQIPNASKDMEGTVLLKPARETWMQLLGEMVQMVNEAVRRRASSVRDASKPLSLEYMADRLDIDDPLMGYMAVTKREGWMQGFITATTWTTWHKSFRWDSLNPALDLTHHHGHDDDDPKSKAKAAERPPPAIDEDGSLATELQAELRAGDPEEGVVWPRVAELSLLGALGCGRWLVELILAELEAEDSQYKYIVTQATDGSIPFYERMGFVRVGAVIVHEPEPDTEGGRSGGDEGGGSGAGKKRKSSGGAAKAQWMCSKHAEYRTPAGEGVEPETVEAVCARHGVSVDDFLFLNAQAPGAKYPKLRADSTLKKDAKFLIPLAPDIEGVGAEALATHDEWYTVREDMAFKKAAEEIGMDPRELLALNKQRPELKGLMVSSELIEGTKLLVRPSRYHFDEYCHWTFADDDQTKGEPSYMMARRLKPKSERRAPAADGVLSRSHHELLVEQRPDVVPSGKRAAFIKAIEDAKLAREKRRQEWADSAWVVVEEDMPFKKFAEKMSIDAKFLRDLNNVRLKGLQLSSLLKRDTWLQIKPIDEVEDYEEEEQKQTAMVNRVVQIDGEDDYEFWYVLTFLPDLQWCHVAPLERRGVFGDKPSPCGHVAEGKDRWMLVSEDQGGEIDVGAGRCHVMEAVEMRGTRANADTEEWDIVGRAPPGWMGPASAEKVLSKKASKKALALEAAEFGESTGGSGSAKGSKKQRKSDGGKGKSAAGGSGNGGGVADASAGLAACRTAVSALARRQDAVDFLEPVDWETLGLDDYPTIVTHPMDLGTVLSKLDAGGYPSVLEACADVDLVWTNCMSYNSEESRIHKDAIKLKTAADKKFAPLIAAENARLEAVSKAAAAAAALPPPSAPTAEAAGGGGGGGGGGAASSRTSTGGVTPPPPLAASPGAVTQGTQGSGEGSGMRDAAGGEAHSGAEEHKAGADGAPPAGAPSVMAMDTSA